MNKIKIHWLQKAFISLIKNVDIIKTGLQGKGGIVSMKSFWKSQKFEKKIVPLRDCKDATQAPLRFLQGRREDAARTPQGRREDAARTPRGRREGAARTPQATRTPRGRREEAARIEVSKKLKL